MSLAASIPVDSLALLIDALAFHGHQPSDTTGFPGPGSWLIFGVVLMPIYVMVISWFVGTPRQFTPAMLGVVYLVGIATVLWVFMLLQTLLIGVVFF